MLPNHRKQLVRNQIFFFFLHFSVFCHGMRLAGQSSSQNQNQYYNRTLEFTICKYLSFQVTLQLIIHGDKASIKQKSAIVFIRKNCHCPIPSSRILLPMLNCVMEKLIMNAINSSLLCSVPFAQVGVLLTQLTAIVDSVHGCSLSALLKEQQYIQRQRGALHFLQF